MKLSENAFQAQVVHLAKLLGWEGVYHTFDSRRSAFGFPDLVLVRPPRVLLIEVKGDGGNLTAEQAEWQEWLRECPGVETWVLWPEDLDSGLIERILRR